MGIETTFVGLRDMPVSIHDRAKIMKVALGADSIIAVYGMAMARLEGGYGCTSCGCYIGDHPEQPPKIDSKKWDSLANHHAGSCKWIRTKGFQIK